MAELDRKVAETKRIRLPLVLPALILVLALFLGMGANRPTETSAAWTSQQTTSGSFSAATIGQVKNFQCIDSKSLLGTGLLGIQVLLTWERPPGAEELPITYEILRNGSLYSTTNDLSYTYQASLSLSLGFTLAVRPKIDGSLWGGTAVTQQINTISLIVPLYFSCAT